MPTQPTWDPHTVPVTFCKSTAEAVEELRNLQHADEVAVDTETVILRDENGKPIPVDFDVDGPGPWRVMSIAARFGHGDGAYYKVWVLDMKYVDAAALVHQFKGVRPWGWNANFDRIVLRRGGLPVRKWKDAMVVEAVIFTGAYRGNGDRAWYGTLEDASERWLGITEIEGKDDVRYSYDLDSELTEEQIRYAADDALATLWVGPVLLAEAERCALTDTVWREINGELALKNMIGAGFPLDPGYRAVVDAAQAAADRAAEKIAVATTGRQLLTTVVRWAQRHEAAQSGTEPTALDDEATVEYGLAVLKDEALFGQFIAALRAQVEVCRQQMATLTGAGEPVEDLFSDGMRYAMPFEPDDENTIRRWLSKAAPVWVTEYVKGSGIGTARLVKGHDLYGVYHALTEADPGSTDVTDELRQLAVVLATYKRYTAILADYGDQVGPVLLKPDWNINSGAQVKDMLNTYSAEQVNAYTLAKDGHAHPLGAVDAVDGDALKLIDSDLCRAMLEFREHSKLVTTYGDELLKFIHPSDGRIHAKYHQALTGTGRLNSSSPNAQNLSPQAKPYIRPPLDAHGNVHRVVVASDLSQAELRFVADMSGDENMLGAFRSGEDLHQRTASLMNTLDMKALKQTGETPIGEITVTVQGLARFVTERPSLWAAKLYKELRSKAKAVAFGYAYGLKGGSLSKQLTVQGVLTSKVEADELLAKFDVAYPQLAAWMAERVAFIQSMSAQMKDQRTPSGCDFEASWQLHRLYAKARNTGKALRAKLGRKATMVEIAEAIVPTDQLRARLAGDGDPEAVTDEQIDAARQSQAANVAWALGHFGSAVLATDGTPWSFESRTKGGRRRLFQVGTKHWVMAMIQLVARSKKPFSMQVRDAWVAGYNAEIRAAWEAAGSKGREPKQMELTKVNPRTHRTEALSNEELEKVFDTPEKRDAFIGFVLRAYDRIPQPELARDYLFRQAMADRIRAMSNQYRNHPIQGGVADAVMDAFALIDDELYERFPTARMIQSVHDSIVIECDLEDAVAIRDMVKGHMESALAAYCPSVPCVADADIQLSLDAEKDTISEERVLELIAIKDAALPAAA